MTETACSLNFSQTLAVDSKSTAVLTIASPGSGKTRVLIERIKRLIADGAAPEKIAAITFTANAAKEMISRLTDPEDFSPLPIGFTGTLHSFLLRQIQEHAAQLSYTSPKLTVLDEEQADALLQQCAAEVMYRGTKETLRAAVASVLRVSVQRGGYSIDKVAATRFVNFLRRHNLLTFDSILFEGLRLLQMRNGVAFDHVLCDEYQDTSDLDAEIYRAMRPTHFFAVGDPDQNCYSFRGANIGNILGLAQRAGVEVITLSENYRCGQAICDAANRLIAHNQNRVAKEMESATGETGEIEVLALATGAEEKARICFEIQVAIQDGASCAVLLRTNALVDEWREALCGFGLPVASKVFSQRPADWRLAKSAVALLADPENDWLAAQFLTILYGSVMAQTQVNGAKAAGKSLLAYFGHIGGYKITPGLPIAAYSQALARIGVSPESVALVDEAVLALPVDATPADLLLALSQTEETATEGEGVFVGTIHLAKGKEWDHVFLPCAEQEIIPGLAKSRDFEEERRLFYVGLTRARSHVTISHANERRKPFGPGNSPATPSQFISELGIE